MKSYRLATAKPKWPDFSTHGYSKDPAGFFEELLMLLGNADGTARILVGGVELPNLMLMAILQNSFPARQYIYIR